MLTWCDTDLMGRKGLQLRCQFKGIHDGDVLTLAPKQKELYTKENVYEIFPEYWLIKVSKFHDRIQDKLDEWIFFLKNEEVKDDFTAKGLLEAKDKLDRMKMNREERAAYKRYEKRMMDIASEQHTQMADAEELMEKGIKKGEKIGKERAMIIES